MASDKQSLYLEAICPKVCLSIEPAIFLGALALCLYIPRLTCQIGMKIVALMVIRAYVMPGYCSQS
jgi:hypothetical protein